MLIKIKLQKIGFLLFVILSLLSNDFLAHASTPGDVYTDYGPFIRSTSASEILSLTKKEKRRKSLDGATSLRIPDYLNPHHHRRRGVSESTATDPLYFATQPKEYIAPIKTIMEAAGLPITTHEDAVATAPPSTATALTIPSPNMMQSPQSALHASPQFAAPDFVKRHLKDVFLQYNLMAVSVSKLRRESMQQRHTLEVLAINQANLRAIRTLQTDLENHEKLGPFYRELLAKLMGTFVWRDFHGHYGHLQNQVDLGDIGILVAMGGLRLIPIPGSQVVGLAFKVVAQKHKFAIKEYKRKLRQRTLKSSTRATEIIQRLAIGLTYTYRDHIPLIDVTTHETLIHNITQVITNILESTVINEEDQVVAFLLNMIPLSIDFDKKLLLSNGNKVRAHIFLKNNGIITADGKHFLPLVMRSKSGRNVLKSARRERSLSFTNHYPEEEFAGQTFRLSSLPLIEVQTGIFTHPFDREKTPYVEYHMGRDDVTNRHFLILDALTKSSYEHIDAMSSAKDQADTKILSRTSSHDRYQGRDNVFRGAHGSGELIEGSGRLTNLSGVHREKAKKA